MSKETQLEAEQAERVAERPGSSRWLGPEVALARFGVRRGETIEREQLIAALQGQHVRTGEQLRRPGSSSARRATTTARRSWTSRAGR